MTELLKSLDISASGMRAQGTRLRVISENVANAGSTALEPGGEPYRRKLVTFGSTLNRQLGAELVNVRRISRDPSPFGLRYQPSHPAADANGYVKISNVDTMIEMADMREAQRSYEANLRVLQTSRTMLERTIDLLR
ncbi:MAG: flagellar basal body rod protein FlgC [Alphaproteobacteria bacterium]|nr:MAG: flagellar basal body rod protein FlgC [Alphaproteobacteria bacterium]